MIIIINSEHGLTHSIMLSYFQTEEDKVQTEKLFRLFLNGEMSSVKPHGVSPGNDLSSALPENIPPTPEPDNNHPIDFSYQRQLVKKSEVVKILFSLMRNEIQTSLNKYKDASFQGIFTHMVHVLYILFINMVHMVGYYFKRTHSANQCQHNII